MSGKRRVGCAPALIGALVAMVVLSYGPVTPAHYGASAPAPTGGAVVLGGAPFSLSVPLATPRTVSRQSAARSPVTSRRALLAAAALLLALACLAGRRRQVPVPISAADASGRSAALGHQRRRGPPLLAA